MTICCVCFKTTPDGVGAVNLCRCNRKDCHYHVCSPCRQKFPPEWSHREIYCPVGDLRTQMYGFFLHYDAEGGLVWNSGSKVAMVIAAILLLNWTLEWVLQGTLFLFHHMGPSSVSVGLCSVLPLLGLGPIESVVLLFYVNVFFSSHLPQAVSVLNGAARHYFLFQLFLQVVHQRLLPLFGSSPTA